MAIMRFSLTPHLFLRDPQSSVLGNKIISTSVGMIDELGFELFTFKKLADDIGSTEASIYRYFENKHRLLLYLMDWYWTWMEYRIDHELRNIIEPLKRLQTCLKFITSEKKLDPSFEYVDEGALSRIVDAEFEKTYHTKQVDADNKEGLFLPYKSFCKKLAEVIKNVNPGYKYPHALISTLMLAVTHQLYYAEHLPSLTEIKANSKNQYAQLHAFIDNLIMHVLQ